MAQHALHHRSCRRPLALAPPAPPTPRTSAVPARSLGLEALGAWGALVFSLGCWVLVIAVAVSEDVRDRAAALWPIALLLIAIATVRVGGPAHRDTPTRTRLPSRRRR